MPAIPNNGEIAEIAERPPRGVWFMNLCLEWGCTSGLMMDPTGPLHAAVADLDWSFRGLARYLALARQLSPAGVYYNMTWPGFTSVVQAMAPLARRMTLRINVNWLVNKTKTFTKQWIPPGHLLRHIIETCRNYYDACDMLAKTPIALLAMFFLVGIKCGEGCVIEPWNAAPLSWRPPRRPPTIGKIFKPSRERGIKRYRGHRLINSYTLSQVINFARATYPVVNKDTRLAMSANPQTEALQVQGFEADGPATQVFDLSHHAGARRTKGVL
jgi:hypothetical protein